MSDSNVLIYWLLIVLLLISLGLAATACVAQYKIHPGALNKTDSAAYDTLLIARTAIDQASEAFNGKLLPDVAKEPLNKLVGAYNVARDAWLLYRGAIATSSPADPYLEQLNRNLASLMEAVKAFEEAQ